MPVFAGLLSSLANYVQRKEPDKALNSVFVIGRDEIDQYEPTLDELQKFLKLFAKAIKGDAQRAPTDPNKTQTRAAERLDGRIAALILLEDYVVNGATPCFSNIDAVKYAFQVAVRVREPSLINQAGVGWCGPAAVLINFAKRDPVGYVMYALELFQSGEAALGAMTVKLKPEAVLGWNLGWPESKGVSEADYVTLAALRASDMHLSVMQDFHGLKVGKGTNYSDMRDWFKRTGFKEVLAKTIVKKGPQGAAVLLDEASQQARKGWIVVLSVNAQPFVSAKKVFADSRADVVAWAAPATRKGETGPVPFKPDQGASVENNHWVLLHKATISGSTADISYTHWGRRYRTTFDLTEVALYFEGFIAARPF